ncbi:MAG TPA: MerR family transcriptional regulator [Prolixibacteraceae bacterium]|nr:MerR family transcriptional regulator [Prolixibacteraceae bacterium]
MAKYSIKDLEHFSGIKAHTIRIWEKRYGLLDPHRTDTNIRLYTDDDVRKILNVSMLVKNGYKISNVASFSGSKIQSEVLRINQHLNDTNKNIDQLLFQTVNLNAVGFESLLDEMIQKNGFRKTLEQVVYPFFGRIGVLWQAGSIFVTHEHFVSNLIRNRLINETYKVKGEELSGKMLLYLRENEWHELGLLYYNYLATQAGLQCVYFGQSLPFEDLKSLLINEKYDFVVTSFVHFIEKSELEDYLSELSGLVSEGHIIISGRHVVFNKPKLPANVTLVKNANEFIRKITQ